MLWKGWNVIYDNGIERNGRKTSKEIVQVKVNGKRGKGREEEMKWSSTSWIRC